MFLVDVSVHLQ